MSRCSFVTGLRAHNFDSLIGSLSKLVCYVDGATEVNSVIVFLPFLNSILKLSKHQVTSTVNSDDTRNLHPLLRSLGVYC